MIPNNDRRKTNQPKSFRSERREKNAVSCEMSNEAQSKMCISRADDTTSYAAHMFLDEKNPITMIACTIFEEKKSNFCDAIVHRIPNTPYFASLTVELCGQTFQNSKQNQIKTLV